MRVVKPALLLLALPLAGCGAIDVIEMRSGGGPRVVGTGKPVKETRKAEAAKDAEFSGALEVTIRKGSPKLEIEAQKEILPHVKTGFKDGRLKVWTEGSTTTDGPVRVRYTTPGLSGVVASGATTVDAEGLVGDSTIRLSGASKLKATGKVGNLDLEASGASEADVVDVATERIELDVSGASTVNVGSPGNLTGDVSGASNVYYQRRPKVLNVQTSGASSVHGNK